MVTALLGAHGLTVGTYTSPHLERINERISRNGEPIADDDAGRRAHRPGRPRAAARATGRRTSSCSPRPRSAGSPTRRSTSPSSRSGCSAAATPPTSSTARSPWSPTSATTTPTARATGGAASPRRRPASSSRAPRSCWARPTPTCADVFDADARGRALAARRRLRRAPRTGSPSAAGCSTCARRAASLRRRVPAAPRRPPGRQRRRRARGGRGVLRAAARRRPRARRRFGARAQPGPLRGRAARPAASSSTARTTPTARRRVGRDARRRLRRRPATRHLVVGMLDGRDPAELLEILDADDAADGRLLHARLAAGPRRPPTLAEHVARARWPRPR